MKLFLAIATSCSWGLFTAVVIRNRPWSFIACVVGSALIGIVFASWIEAA